MSVPSTPKGAKAAGALYYFTGKPCLRGHVAQRMTSNATCVECDAIAKQERYRCDPAPAIEKAARWASENPESRRRIKARWRGNNLEKAHESERKSRARTAGKRQLWLDANRDFVRALKRNRRALQRGADGCHTADDIARIREAQRDTCAYCSKKLKGKGHVDHIIALSKGGSNWPSNLQLTCDACNLRKGAKDPIDFAATLGMLL